MIYCVSVPVELAISVNITGTGLAYTATLIRLVNSPSTWDSVKQTMSRESVAMLHPGHKKTHRAYLWAYAPGAFQILKAVVYDFCESRAGEHAHTFLGEWTGALVCDDFAGYKQSLTL